MNHRVSADGIPRDPWVALAPGVDPRRQAAELRRVHAATAAEPGGAAPTLRPTIRDSWQRSAAGGARPDGAGAPAVLDLDDVEERRHVHPLAATLPALRQLLRSGSDEFQHIVVVSDADGVLLWVEGPPREISQAADDMNFVPGSDWSEAGVGTNSIGTSIAADHAIQVFSAEHYNTACHRWTCSGAPIHDPATGAVLGAIDITTDLHGYHPIGHRLVLAAARVAEGVLTEELHRREHRLLEHYLRHATDRYRAPSAVASADGRVLAAFPPEWIGSRVPRLPHGGGEIPAMGLVAEPVLGGAGYVVTPLAGGVSAPAILQGASAGPAVELTALGRSSVRCRTADGTVELSSQHSELVVLLALHPAGMSGRELADQLGTDTPTVRTAMRRLRGVLGEVVLSRPYRLRPPVAADLLDLADDLDAGRCDHEVGPLLPGSTVPAIVAARDRLAREHTPPR